MDVNQLASMIEWLDEQRRQDRALISALEQRLERQTEEALVVQRRVNTVESDQAQFRQEAMPAQREHDIIDNLRSDMEEMLEQAEARRLTAERETERRLELQRETFQRAVRELSGKAERIERQLANISDLQSEGDRLQNAMRILNQEMEDLTKQLEGPDRRLAFLEEQRRSDARRLAEIETEMPEYKKSVDGISPKLALVEDLTRRNERRLQDIGNSERERREQIQQFIDQQQLLSQQRDQQMADLQNRFGSQDDDLQKYIERFEVWAGAYREMKRIIDDFNRIGDRLERSLPQVRGLPVLTLSALTGRGVNGLLPKAFEIYEVWNRRVDTGPLNRWFADAVDRHPPPIVDGRRLRLRYITQVKARPPTFALFTTRPSAVPESYLRYLTNGLRDDFGLPGVPIRIALRKGRNPYVAERG